MALHPTITNTISGKNSVLSKTDGQKYAEIGRFTPRNVKHGLRRHKTIAKELAFNLDRLENGEWVTALKKCNELSGRKPTTKRRERYAARYIQETFKGFGSKQSRNLLQMLGLTRHEIPIDSRMSRWLLQFGYPPPLSGKLLGDKEYYELVLDDVQALCKKAGVPPCLFDAMVFRVKANGKGDR